MDFHTAFPLRSCAKGGRKVIMRHFLVKIKVLIEGEKRVRPMIFLVVSPVHTILSSSCHGLSVTDIKKLGFLCVQITSSKVFMVCDSALAKDVEPRFEIHDHQGRHLQDKDDLLTQPRLAGGQQV